MYAPSYLARSPQEALPQRGVEAVHEALYEIGLPEDHYIVVGGANMVLRGIKQTTEDVDILVSQEAYNVLATRSEVQTKNPPARARYMGATNTTLELHVSPHHLPVSATRSLGDGWYPLVFENCWLTTERVGFVPCLSLDDVIGSKKAIRRPKDIEDLRLIEQHLGYSLGLSAVKANTSKVFVY